MLAGKVSGLLPGRGGAAGRASCKSQACPKRSTLCPLTWPGSRQVCRLSTQAAGHEGSLSRLWE